jgi:hypothetical protein
MRKWVESYANRQGWEGVEGAETGRCKQNAPDPILISFFAVGEDA